MTCNRLILSDRMLIAFQVCILFCFPSRMWQISDLLENGWHLRLCTYIYVSGYFQEALRVPPGPSVFCVYRLQFYALNRGVTTGVCLWGTGCHRSTVLWNSIEENIFKIKVILPQSAPWRPKGEGGCSYIYPLIFNVAVGGGEWPASLLCRFTPGTTWREIFWTKKNVNNTYSEHSILNTFCNYQSFFYSPTNAQVIILKTVLKFTLK